MSPSFLRFNQVHFAHEGAATPLFADLTLQLGRGWTGVVGPNGAGKTTLLQLASGLLSPGAGLVERPREALYCAQRTDEAPEALEPLLTSTDRSARLVVGQLGLEDDWRRRWTTLSHGERKRAQLGVALWRAPELLAIDEPTNHVDAEARGLLQRALGAFAGIGLLVSHDRELLDALCTQCLFLEPPRAIVRPGGYSRGHELAREEQAALRSRRAVRQQALDRLRREAGKRRDAANQADRRRSKKGLAKQDHDAKGRIDAARVSGKDGVGGKLLRQLDGRLERAQDALQDLQVAKEQRTGIWLPGSRSRRSTLLDLAAGALALGDHRTLQHPRLFLRRDDRVGITGPNGAGKSTLLRALVAALQVEPEHLTYVPQEIALERSRALLDDARALPPDRKGHLMTIVNRLGSLPQRLLESASPSPGETRKLLLALSMTREPHVIVMDEPTNHMDLPSIECLEQALADCPCCLVLVSHDRPFLAALTRQRWQLAQVSAGSFELNVG